MADLADIAGMSRSSFADTLRDADRRGAAALPDALAAAARQRNAEAGGRAGSAMWRGRVGYDSDAAFSRAFKAQFGVPPVQTKRVTG